MSMQNFMLYMDALFWGRFFSTLAYLLFIWKFLVFSDKSTSSWFKFLILFYQHNLVLATKYSLFALESGVTL